MNPERMTRIEALYTRASALDAPVREVFLRNACAGDEELRSDIESLLAHEKEAEDFIETSAFQIQLASLAEGWQEISTVLTGRSIGRYQIREMIGAGGMGVVYRAIDTRLGRTVAVKVLSPLLAADTERRDRFACEAKAASALNHPNIITIFDIDQADGIDFISMEYLEGETLRDIIAARELSISESLSYAIQVARALAAAHSAGIVHLDIKPANIVVSGKSPGSQYVKVLDFGLARLSARPLSDAFQTPEEAAMGRIFGTTAYMSPEMAEGKPVDARSDIFALGAVLYEMLSRRRPFGGDSPMATLDAVLHNDPAPLPGIPGKLRNIVERCLYKDSCRRFQSAVDLELALESCRPSAIRSTRPIKTIAVLPFASLGGDKEDEYFSDGLTEEIINALARVRQLRVTARTSAFAMRGKELDIREIGAKLHVKHVLEGSVHRSGRRVRVMAQLVAVADGYQLWSERYDREITDMLAIQDEISRAIVDTLKLNLVKDSPVRRRHNTSTEAYSLYLRGRHYHERHTPESYTKARQCFELALAADPRYALASLGLAEFHWQTAFYGFRYPREALISAKEATIRALEIDDLLAEGHALMGTLLGVSDWDWRAAESAFNRALELEENSPYVLSHYANFYLWPQGRTEEAIDFIERTLSFDPLSVVAHWVLAYFTYAKRQFERAVKHLLAVMEMEPDFYLAHCVIGLAYAQQGLRQESIAAFQRSYALCPAPFTLGMLAYGFGKFGQTDETKKIVDELQSSEQSSYVPAKSLMFACAGLDDLEAVLLWAEKSVNDRDPMVVMNIRHEPALDPVRSDPRYLALLRKIHLQS